MVTDGMMVTGFTIKITTMKKKIRMETVVHRTGVPQMCHRKNTAVFARHRSLGPLNEGRRHHGPNFGGMSWGISGGIITSRVNDCSVAKTLCNPYVIQAPFPSHHRFCS